MNSLKVFFETPFDPKLSHLLDDSSLVKTSFEDCDLVIHHQVLWADKATKKRLKSISEENACHQKKVVVFIVNDYEYKYRYYDNLILLRTSLRASLQKDNEYVLPYAWECSKVAFSPLNTSKRPIVGFCGMSNKYRKKNLTLFKQASEVQDHFILRKRFWGGAPHDPKIVDDFTRNIKDSHYILCDRGKGNFSMRFYQTLAFGRIPVVLNTDMELPLKKEVPWSEAIIFETSEKLCLERVIESFQTKDYLAMQAKCREIHEDFFHPKKVLFLLLRQLIN